MVVHRTTLIRNVSWRLFVSLAEQWSYGSCTGARAVQLCLLFLWGDFHAAGGRPWLGGVLCFPNGGPFTVLAAVAHFSNISALQPIAPPRVVLGWLCTTLERFLGTRTASRCRRTAEMSATLGVCGPPVAAVKSALRRHQCGQAAPATACRFRGRRECRTANLGDQLVPTRVQSRHEAPPTSRRGGVACFAAAGQEQPEREQRCFDTAKLHSLRASRRRHSVNTVR